MNTIEVISPVLLHAFPEIPFDSGYPEKIEYISSLPILFRVSALSDVDWLIILNYWHYLQKAVQYDFFYKTWNLDSDNKL